MCDAAGAGAQGPSEAGVGAASGTPGPDESLASSLRSGRVSFSLVDPESSNSPLAMRSSRFWPNTFLGPGPPGGLDPLLLADTTVSRELRAHRAASLCPDAKRALDGNDGCGPRALLPKEGALPRRCMPSYVYPLQ